MSQKMQSVYSILDKLDSSLLLHLGHELNESITLSNRDWNTYKDSIMMWFCYNHDLNILHLNDQLIWRVLYSICEMNCCEFLAFLKSLDKLFISKMRAGNLRYESCKRSLTNVNQKTIFSIYKGVLTNKEMTEVEKFKVCHTSSLFLSRLSLKDRSDLQEQACSKYIKENDHIYLGCPDEAKTIREWFPRSLTDVAQLIQDTVLNVDHGPGTTADCGRYLCNKYAHLRFTQKQRMLINKVMAQLKIPDTSPFRVLMEGGCESHGEQLLQTHSVSETIFVPKSADSLRTINTEPAGTMFLEQGAMRAILQLISRRGHKLSRRINLEQQDLNRDLAWEGSIDGSYATIDLSAASDSVSWELIAHWFDSTSLQELVTCLRSSRFSVNGQTFVSNKFAPMGSALCFPIECIVFAAIVEVAIRSVGADPATSRYRVYGDDIIVEGQYAAAVMQRLVLNGFRVNCDKSYYDLPGEYSHYYRESCGGEYVDGEDVTPFRLSRRFAGLSSLTPSKVNGLVELCNTFYNRKVLRGYIINSLKKELTPAKMPLFDSTGLKGIYSPCATNFNKKSSYSVDYQCYVYEHCVGALKPRRLASAEVAYLATLHALSKTQRKSLLFPEDAVSISKALQTKEVWVTHFAVDETVG